MEAKLETDRGQAQRMYEQSDVIILLETHIISKAKLTAGDQFVQSQNFEIVATDLSNKYTRRNEK